MHQSVVIGAGGEAEEAEAEAEAEAEDGGGEAERESGTGTGTGTGERGGGVGLGAGSPRQAARIRGSKRARTEQAWHVSRGSFPEWASRTRFPFPVSRLPRPRCG